jgi:predicted Zn-dependent peptidase
VPTLPRYPFTDHRLDNGLRLIVSEDHLAPVAAVNLWYDVGSRHEQPGLTGLAHLFEHLMFQGSEHVARGEHFALINKAGGTLNGTTWCDRTNYYETLPAHHVSTALWLEADRMGGLLAALDQDNLDNQRDVVKNEKRQRHDNQPYGSWSEHLHGLGWPQGHPYHHTTIGSMADLDAASLEDVREFFTTWYAPDNAVLSVVGDVDTADIVREVERLFGGIEPRGQFPKPPEVVVPQRFDGERRLVVSDEVPTPRVFVGYRIAPFGSPEWDAATIAATVLGGGRGSRLYGELVLRRQLMHEPDGDIIDGWPFVDGATMLIADLPAREGVDPEALESAFHDGVTQLADGVTDEEIERARAMTTSAWLHHLSAVEGRADTFSEYATLFGDPALVEQALPRLLAVTGDDVRRVASEALRPENRVVLTFLPNAEPAAADEVAA